MKPLYTQKQYDLANSQDKLPCECYHCHQPFKKMKKEITCFLNGDTNLAIKYCSRKCYGNYIKKSKVINCSYCDSKFTKKLCEIKSSKNHFCSRSCSATYNNKHKKHGTRRSKLEVWLEEELTTLYPDLPIDYNKKDAIGSELDIYIPSLNLAIEINGIFHYEPIYGKDKLGQIQENDISKSKACHDAKVDLCIIDASGLSYFKTKNAQKYLDIVVGIINERLLLII